MHPRAVRELAFPIDAEELIEREPELQALREALTGIASARGAVVLVEGAAGTGKSCLISALADLAGGVVICRARAVELDRALPLAVARRLFAPRLRDAARCSRHDYRVERALDALMRS
ncbi:MAG TPA: AAA family ATPase, partial [Solirubrobacter sp.]|nr:AAA family ATPase [Solirubrobacter sp.]